MRNPTLTASPELAADTSFDPSQFESINGDQLLNDVTEFIGRYLRCSEHQRNVLALWVLHTHCLPAAQVTPYLAIQSAEKQSGKSLCLQLLSLLCDHPALAVGLTANSLTRRIDGPISTVLLDECQATVGTRARSKGPALRAILAGGYQCGPGYMDSTHERNTFSPKAFAGMGQLPEALADRSIPIILKPLRSPGGAGISCLHSNATKSSASAAAGEKVQRFNLRRAAEEAKALQDKLHLWADGSELDLEEKPSYSHEDFPPNLSTRRQDMIEPLLQLADYIGGEWPARIRQALAAVFLQEAAFELAHSLQLLADIRDCFAHYNFPKGLSSATLLAWMHTRPPRPWDVDGPLAARALARLLMPFDIHPEVHRIGKADPARGYLLEDFVRLWQTHLGFTIPDQGGLQSQPADSLASAVEVNQRADINSANPLLVTHDRQSEMINKDAGCNAVTHSGAILVSAAQNPQAKPRPNGKIGSPAGKIAAVHETGQRKSGKSLLVTHDRQSEMINKDAGCNAVTHSGAISVSTAENSPAKANGKTGTPVDELTGRGQENQSQEAVVASIPSSMTSVGSELSPGAMRE